MVLTKATDKDFLFIYQLYMHPTINPYLMYEPMDENTFIPIFNNLIQQDILYICNLHDEQVGMCKLIPLPYRSAHGVYCGSVAIHPNYMGKGLGKKMMQQVVKHAIELGFKRIELSVAVENIKAIELYKSVGFYNVGLLKNYTFLQLQNRYVDEWMMECLLD
jgi:ribosomal protein S18 acetylase RimI-like enzyme